MDVSTIAEKMIDDMNERHHCTVAGLKDSLMNRLETYKWPGNVRELRNTIERAVILAGSGMLEKSICRRILGSLDLLRSRRGRPVMACGCGSTAGAAARG